MDGEQLQRKLQTEVENVINKIEKNKIRPIQKNAYLQMAKCYDQPDLVTQNDVQRCAHNASRLSEAVQNVVQNEMNQFQNRLQRAMVSCQDEATDFYKKKEDQSGAEKVMFKCMGGVVDKHIRMLPDVQYNIEKGISQLSASHNRDLQDN